MEIRVFVKFTRPHGNDVVVVVVVVVVAVAIVVVIMNESNMKVECRKKISPSLHPCFYNKPLMLILSRNLILSINWISCNYFGCVVAYL